MDAEIVAWCERVRGCEGMQLMAELHQLARRDRRSEVRMLVYLGEVDERRLFLGEGFSSMFRYATAVLRMSEPQTFLRIQIARLAKKFPMVLEMLAEGALNLSTLKLLDPHLTNDNHVALLERARNKTKREVELLVAELAPKPDVPSTIRKLPEPAAPRQVRDGQHLLVPEAPASLPAEQAAAVQDTAVRAAPVVAPAQVQRVPVAFALEAPRAASTPLRPGRYKWEMTAGQSLQDKLMRLQQLLRHQVPGGDLAAIVELAFDVLIEKKLKQRFAQVSKPRASAVKSGAVVAGVRGSTRDDMQTAGARDAVDPGVSAVEDVVIAKNALAARPLGTEAEQVSRSEPRRRTRSRYIPRAVLREVFARDGAQCTFISPAGQRCSERGMLELDHVRAFELGGEATVENLRVLCRGHNGFYADQDFGAAHMRMKRASSKT